jgi:hypothetical protein
VAGAALVASGQPAGSDTAQLWGVIASKSAPVVAAKVRLESYLDEACVKLAEAEKLSPEQDKVVKACASELPAISSDARGEFHFRNLKPGWYKLLVEWDLKEKPASVMPVQWQGDYTIAYYETKTGQKKYSALAQGKIKKLAPGERQRRDFDWKNSAEPLS